MADHATILAAVAKLPTAFSHVIPPPKPKAKAKPGYRGFVEWIAFNDDVELGGEGGWLVTIMMVADLFGKDADEVGVAVARCRKRNKL